MRTRDLGRGFNTRLLVAVVTSCMILVACSGLPASATEPRPVPLGATATASSVAKSIAPHFEPADCKNGAVAGAIECGYLIVPEERSQPAGQTIRLHVAIVKSRSQNPAADPVIFLQGGPGTVALDRITGIVKPFGSVLENRDLIVFDQRGVGYSQPSLDCPEVDENTYESLANNRSRSDQLTRMLQAYGACRDRLRNQGVSLDAYNSAANAADVNDLRLALGYDKVNLYGVSYGTRLALTVMRDFPAGVRSAILDSTIPPQVDFGAGLAFNAVRSFDLLFDRCAQDAGCNAAFPDLNTTFFSLVARLDTAPVQVEIAHPTNGKVYTVSVDGDRLIDDMFQMLYSTSALRFLPKMISDMSSGDYALFSRLATTVAFLSDNRSEGMYTSVMCAEELAFSSPQAVESTSAQLHPRLREALAGDPESKFALCAVWGVKKAGPIENAPVVSNIPTFVLAGEFDPVTPPAMANQAMATLSRSYYYESPNTGHGALSGGGFCARDMATNFLDDPDKSPVYDCHSPTFFFAR